MPLLQNIGSGASSGALVGSVIPGIGTAIGAGVGGLMGGLGSLFSSESEQTKSLRDLLNRLKAVQGYTRDEIEQSVGSFNAAGTASIADAANSYAIGSNGRQGFINAAVSKMVPTIAQLGADRRARMEDFNKNLELDKIKTAGGLSQGLDQDSPQSNFMSAMSLAAKGAQIGMQFPDDNTQAQPLKLSGTELPGLSAIEDSSKTLLGSTLSERSPFRLPTANLEKGLLDANPYKGRLNFLNQLYPGM